MSPPSPWPKAFHNADQIPPISLGAPTMATEVPLHARASGRKTTWAKHIYYQSQQTGASARTVRPGVLLSSFYRLSSSFISMYRAWHSCVKADCPQPVSLRWTVAISVVSRAHVIEQHPLLYGGSQGWLLLCVVAEDIHSGLFIYVECFNCLRYIR